MFKIVKDSNEPESREHLGSFYLNRGYESHYNKKFEEACGFLGQAANLGNSQAMLNLGVVYFKGDRVEKNLDLAEKYLKDAKNSGVVKAKQFLVDLYKDRGVQFYQERNFQKAREYFKKAARKGNSQAMHELGHMYFQGNGVEKKWKKAGEWFKKAKNSGFVEADKSLGILYFSSGFEFYKNKKFVEARKYFEQAARKGNPQAKYYLAKIYSNGDGIERNLDMAIKYLTDAYDSGFVEDKQNSGDVYVSLGIQYYQCKKFAEARECFEQAARKGNPKAMHELGAMYISGEIGENLDLAEKWLKKAIEAGCVEAKKTLGNIYKYFGSRYFKGQGVEKSELKALGLTLRSFYTWKNTNTAVGIKTLLNLNITSSKPTDDSDTLHDALVKCSLINGGSNSKVNLQNVSAYHNEFQQKDTPNVSSKQELVDSSLCHEYHSEIANFSGKLLDFLTKIARNNGMTIPSSNNSVEPDKLPKGFMLTNLNPMPELLNDYHKGPNAQVIQGIGAGNEPFFSIIELGGQKFYNVGIEAVKFSGELENVMKEYKTAKTAIGKLLNLTSREKSVQKLSTHNHFIDELEKNLAEAFKKSAYYRNQGLLDYLDGK